MHPAAPTFLTRSPAPRPRGLCRCVGCVLEVRFPPCSLPAAPWRACASFPFHLGAQDRKRLYGDIAATLERGASDWTSDRAGRSTWLSSPVTSAHGASSLSEIAVPPRRACSFRQRAVSTVAREVRPPPDEERCRRTGGKKIAPTATLPPLVTSAGPTKTTIYASVSSATKDKPQGRRTIRRYSQT